MVAKTVAFLVRTILQLRYDVKVTGVEKILNKGNSKILILPNHPALVDPMIMVSRLQPLFFPVILADKDQIDLPFVRWVAKKLKAFPMLDPAVYGDAAKEDVERAMKRCVEEMKKGENLLLYPAGRIYRSRLEEIGGNSSVERILKEVPGVRVVLVRTRGLWGSSFSYASGKRPDFFKTVLRGFKLALLGGIFFLPRRKVVLEFFEPDNFPIEEGRFKINRYLEEFYNMDAPYNTFVPYSFFSGKKAGIIAEPEISVINSESINVPESTRKIILEHIREVSGVESLSESSLLAKDLGMDSLLRAELIAWIEQEFGYGVDDPESIQTVGSCVLAACGMAISGKDEPLSPISHEWFGFRSADRVVIPEGDTIMEAFISQLEKGPGRVAAADQSRGVLSYRKILITALALSSVIRKIEGKYVGIMLPALSGIPIMFLAVHFSGKIPVMVNWTMGARNIKHSLDLLGVKAVLTASQFLAKIQDQGTDLTEIKGNFIFLESVAKGITITSKLSALFKSHFNLGILKKIKTDDDTAVVLFTSGSESFPKAVPLTHGNILTNLRDMAKVIDLKESDSFIGFLPPFHSFGLTVTVMLPLCGGMRGVYHPNPTDGRMIARLTGAYRASLMIGTPTFLESILRSSSGKELDTVRIVVTGAEKCPERVYDMIQRKYPSMVVLEGYGITECSPVVSVNIVEDTRAMTIGKVLPSVEYVIRDVDTGEVVPAGERGMLFVRGKSVFGGYLKYDGPSPFENFNGKEWYRTGDIVIENEGKHLSFAGRLKRFIKIGGEMISLPAIEEVLLKAFQPPDLKDIVLAVESTGSETSPEIVLFTVLEMSREKANSVIRGAGLSPLHNIRIIKRIEAIPLLGTGKTDYRSLKNINSFL